MNFFEPLLADLDDWIKWLIFLFIFGGPLINQLGKVKAKPKPQPRPLPPGRPPQPPRPGAAQAAQPGRNVLEDEIDEFLRQARQKNRGQRPQRRQPPRQKPQPQRQQAQQPRRLTQRERARAQQLAKAEKPKKSPPRPRRPLGEGVGRHVDEHISAHPVTEHSKQLGKTIANADERVEGHLHEVFDHELGQLGTTTADTPIREGTDAAVWADTEQRRQQESALRASQAADIARLLQSPIGMREAIILGEILKSPKGLDETRLP